MNDFELIQEFLIESNESLVRLDQELVELERNPQDARLLASIFRSFHTIKRTSGCLGFNTLRGITHSTETILSQLRDGERILTPDLATLILQANDAVKSILQTVERTSTEGDEEFLPLWALLDAATAVENITKEIRKALPAPVEPVLPSRPAEPMVEPKTSASSTRSSAMESTVRVDVGLLEKLMNLVGELVLAHNQIIQYSTQRGDHSISTSAQRLNLITTELQESVMKTRMQPIGNLWNKLPRVVRDIAASCGKQIEVEMEGADTELDRTVIEAIKDPITHIVRNACDHGIERPEVRTAAGKPAVGKLLLRAFHEGGNVNIEISDDGAGVNSDRVREKALRQGLITEAQAKDVSPRDLINLIFLPGFSTAREVTSISGRGVGMDVVRTHIEKIGGVVEIQSKSGAGTLIKIRIPRRLAIIPGVVVTCAGERFVIPQVNLLELIRVEGGSTTHGIEEFHGCSVYRR
ncbi:MAG TPA: chemotaxis protein CheA [Bryobacteraceae bacterium]|nr:chemotaxis protein CheA [Bryobacteraceae bacterium]